MDDLTAVQILAFLLLAALAGAVVQDLTFGRLDRIRARRAERHAANLQRRLERLEASRTIHHRHPLHDEIAS